MSDSARVEVLGLRLELPSNQPVLVLREVDDARRVMTIYIGGPEASAIHTALEGTKPPRPLTHDLVLSLLESVGAQLRRVTITEIRSQTYYADLLVEAPGRMASVSGRPSDGVALALRAGAEIFVSRDLLDEVGKPLEDDAPGAEDESVVDEFRDFLESISPDDFSDPTS